MGIFLNVKNVLWLKKFEKHQSSFEHAWFKTTKVRINFSKIIIFLFSREYFLRQRLILLFLSLSIW